MLNECNGCEYKCSLSHIDICTLGSPCPHQKPLTNEEYIRSCSTEELAEVLLEIYKDGINDYKTDWWEDSKEDWMEGLKEKHE